jgi:hypothetical protein
MINIYVGASRFLVAIGLVILTASSLRLHGARAETPTPSPPTATPTVVSATPISGRVVITVPRRMLDLPLNLPDRPHLRTMAEGIVSISVYADGVFCTSVSLTGPDNRGAAGEKILVLGEPGQPAECSREGARITIRDGRGPEGQGFELAWEATLQRGRALEIDNFAPKPPHSGGEDASRLPSTGGGAPAGELAELESELLLLGAVGLSVALGLLLLRLVLRRRSML